MMDARERIEESHGLWEMCIVRLAALVEAGANESLICDAVTAERAAFKVWQETSNAAMGILR